jgi:hypothetical protein
MYKSGAQFNFTTLTLLALCLVGRTTLSASLIHPAIVTAPSLGTQAEAKATAAAQDNLVYLPVIMKLSQALAIKNGGSEQGYTEWNWDPSDGMITAVYSHSGIYSAMLGDGTHSRSAKISQQVNVQADNPNLVFYLLMNSSDVCDTDPHVYDYTAVTIDDAEVWVEAVCANNSSDSWIRQNVNLSAYAGQTVMLAFVFMSDSMIESRLFLDDVQLEP